MNREILVANQQVTNSFTEIYANFNKLQEGLLSLKFNFRYYIYIIIGDTYIYGFTIGIGLVRIQF